MSTTVDTKQLDSKPTALSVADESLVLEVAREALRMHLEGKSYSPPHPAKPLAEPEGIFVTLRSPGGELRGCIGHIGHVDGPLLQSVVECAVASATRDPRFPPVTRDELDDLRMEVSLLGPLQPVADRSVLDPQRWGVVCTQGWRRGVLLPEVEGVDTVDYQLEIACRKGGIDMATDFVIQRFEVIKLVESADAAKQSATVSASP